MLQIAKTRFPRRRLNLLVSDAQAGCRHPRLGWLSIARRGVVRCRHKGSTCTALSTTKLRLEYNAIFVSTQLWFETSHSCEAKVITRGPERHQHCYKALLRRWTLDIYRSMPHKSDRLRHCPCCKSVVSQDIYHEHQLRQIENHIGGLVLAGSPEGQDQPVINTTFPSETRPLIITSTSSSTPSVTASSRPPSSAVALDMYQELTKTEATTKNIYQEVVNIFSAWDSGISCSKLSPQFLTRSHAILYIRNRYEQLQDQLVRIKTVKLSNDPANIIYVEALVDQLQGHVFDIRRRLEQFDCREASITTRLVEERPSYDSCACHVIFHCWVHSSDRA